MPKNELGPGSTWWQRAKYDWPVLSIKQPWAQLIIEGAKDVEIRSWTTTYRGRIWIHTGQKVDDYATARFARSGLFTGGLVGHAHLYGVRPFCASSWEAWRYRHKDDADFDEAAAKYGWILRDARPLVQGIRYKGSIGLFRLDEAVLEQLGQIPDLLPVSGARLVE
jgi:hypothetical protein